MQHYTIPEHWVLLSERVRERWGLLTRDDLREISGNREHLARLLSESYGLSSDDAWHQIEEFELNQQVVWLRPHRAMGRKPSFDPSPEQVH